MNLNCIIIDDEPLALELLQSYVKKTSFLNLCGTYPNAIQAMKEMAGKEPVHLVFLDIQMPGIDGLEFSKLIDSSTRIIFTTAFNQYAVDSYKVNALDYLLKPISYADFLQAVNKAVHWFDLQNKENTSDICGLPKNHDFIFVKSDYKLIQIPFDDIVYIEGLKDYVKIHLENEQKPILSLLSMKNLEERLPSNRFIRVHRSYIVQKSKIKVIDRGRIVFKKDYIPISESYKQELFSYINEHSI